MKTKNIQNFNLLKLLNLTKIERQLIFIFSLIVFVITNLLVANFSWKADFSYGKAYTLAPATKNILRKLDDLVTIKFFVSSDIPTKLLPVKMEVVDLLNEYKKESNKVQIKVFDPKKDEKALSEAKESGLPELQFSQLENDKYALSTAYFGILVTYLDKKEVLPQIKDLSNLEYDLTAMIYKMLRKDIPRIGLNGDSDSSSSSDNYSNFKQVLTQQFSYEAVDLKDISSEIKTLLVFDNAKKEFSDQEIDGLKQYLKNGGKALFFVNGVWVGDRLTADKAQHNLDKVLLDWGIRVNSDLILSTAAEIVNFGSDAVSYLSAYPFWLKTNVFNQPASFFSNINQVMFPWASSLTLEKKNGFDIRPLIFSTKRSWAQKNSYLLLPNNIPQPQPSDLKQYILAADSKKKNGGGEVIVIGSGRFLQDRYQGNISGNIELVLNMLNDLVSGGALSGIRQRAIIYYPLPELMESQKDLFKYVNILLLPGIFALIGAYKLVKRK